MGDKGILYSLFSFSDPNVQSKDTLGNILVFLLQVNALFNMFYITLSYHGPFIFNYILLTRVYMSSIHIY